MSDARVRGITVEEYLETQYKAFRVERRRAQGREEQDRIRGESLQNFLQRTRPLQEEAKCGPQ